MHYKIVSVSDQCPDKPTTYIGEIPADSLCEDQPLIIQALSAEFGTPTEEDKTGLTEWAGGELRYWTEDLEEDRSIREFQVCNFDVTYHVFVDDKALTFTTESLQFDSETHALTLESLIDGDPCDDLGKKLQPIVDFLRGVTADKV